jgi:1-aminocyclopropane-1-carboxylate deaminase
MIFNLQKSINEPLHIPNIYGVDLFLKREDKIHSIISGNKYRKLKYNIEAAKNQGCTTILTFGGAFSNHIAAVAAVGKEFNFKTVGIIRGEELADKIQSNPTLKYAESCGMQFKFISRALYREKQNSTVIEKIVEEFSNFYLVPEGGTNKLAIKGCEEILNQDDKNFNFVCCSVGTGGTIAGIINSSKSNQYVVGFPALKGSFLKEDISKFVNQNNWDIVTDYHFGGYAKMNVDLINFINQFKKDNNIQLDPVYTGKMMFGIYDLLEKGYFPKGSKVLAIHTGGLQGINGMNNLLKKKNMPLID